MKFELTPGIREQIRLSILRYALGGRVTVSLLRSYLRGEGFSAITDCQVQTEVEYLVDKELLKSLEKEVSPEVGVYRTSAEGMDYLAKQGAEH